MDSLAQPAPASVQGRLYEINSDMEKLEDQLLVSVTSMCSGLRKCGLHELVYIDIYNNPSKQVKVSYIEYIISIAAWFI